MSHTFKNDSYKNLRGNIFSSEGMPDFKPEFLNKIVDLTTGIYNIKIFFPFFTIEFMRILENF